MKEDTKEALLKGAKTGSKIGGRASSVLAAAKVFGFNAVKHSSGPRIATFAGRYLPGTLKTPITYLLGASSGTLITGGLAIGAAGGFLCVGAYYGYKWYKSKDSDDTAEE